MILLVAMLTERMLVWPAFVTKCSVICVLVPYPKVQHCETQCVSDRVFSTLCDVLTRFKEFNTLVNHAKFEVTINVVLFLHKPNNGNHSTASYLHHFYKNSSIVLYIQNNISRNIRPVRMLNSTIRCGTLFFKCFGTFLHN